MGNDHAASSRPSTRSPSLRRHLVDKVAVSDFCKEYGEAESGPRREQELEARVKHFEAQLVRKDEVIAEISAEYVHPKKNLGSPDRPMGSP